MRFSNKEKKDLWISALLISAAFAILLSGGARILFSFNREIFVLFGAAFMTAGLGFILHELMHKFVAQSYGLNAEYRAFYPMLFLMLLLSFAGFIFAAPGAVFIHGSGLTRKRNGKISLAGPMTNLILAIVFLFLVLAFGTAGAIGSILSFGLSINSLLAAFNMIPVMPFDGAKVLVWSKGVYFATLVLAVGLFAVSWIL